MHTLIAIFFFMLEYLHVQKPIQKAIEMYGPIELGDFLFFKKILNPIHYSILKTLTKVPKSYQSSVLYKMLIIEFKFARKYLKFKEFVQSISSLKIISTIISDVGK